MTSISHTLSENLEHEIDLDDDPRFTKIPFEYHHPEVRKEIAKVMKQLQKNPNIISTLFINNWGLPEETTMKIMVATLTARVLRPFVWRCEHVVRDLNPDDTLVAVRIKTLKHEILMACDYDVILVVLLKLSPAPVLYPKAPRNKEY